MVSRKRVIFKKCKDYKKKLRKETFGDSYTFFFLVSGCFFVVYFCLVDGGEILEMQYPLQNRVG